MSNGQSSTATQTYEFDAEFQTLVAALCFRDTKFNELVSGLIKPEYFDDAAESILVELALEYFEKYKTALDKTTAVFVFKEALAKKRIRKQFFQPCKDKLGELLKLPLAGRAHAADKVAEFASLQAFQSALIDSIDLLEKKDLTKAKSILEKSFDVGINVDTQCYDFFAEIDNRKDHRNLVNSGVIKPTGISTGMKALDNLLMHRGFGREELSVLQGAAKAGKTTALLHFANAAALQGHNVFYATCEVARKILTDRIEANFTRIAMNNLNSNLNKIASEIHHIKSSCGAYLIKEFGSGQLTPSILKRVLEKQRANGTDFDLIVVDYADIMRPDLYTQDKIENSKQVYLDLRAVAQEYNAAVLTATQSNREGFKAVTQDMTHVAEDINKVRTCDLLMSINKTEEEIEKHEARIFIAANRNGPSNITVRIRQKNEAMVFIDEILGIE